MIYNLFIISYQHFFLKLICQISGSQKKKNMYNEKNVTFLKRSNDSFHENV